MGLKVICKGLKQSYTFIDIEDGKLVHFIELLYDLLWHQTKFFERCNED